MPKKRKARRTPLSKELVLRSALQLADDSGLGAVSMRALAELLGVEAMSLYHHFPNKDAILDRMVDAVFSEIELPAGGDWRAALRTRSLSARAVLVRHPWALSVIESRKNPGPATLQHHDAVIGTLRAAGFSVAMAAHAFSAIDSYVYGFVLQELNLPFKTPEELEAVASQLLASMPADTYPHLTELTRELVLKPGYAYANELAFGLELILEGFERLRAS